MDIERYLIPRRLDDPPQLYFWDADEVVIILFFAFLSLMLGHPIVGVAIGLLVRRAFVRVKVDGGKGIIQRFLYWYTPSQWWFKGRAASHRREYIG